MKQKLLYIMDPLCGWTYGNSENFLTFYHEYKEIYDFEIIVGGIKLNNQVSLGGPEMTAYIKNAGIAITKLTNAEFSDIYFENLASNPKYIFDSKPPSKAIVTMRFLDNINAIPYAHRLQIVQFVEGKNINDESVLADIASEFNVDRTEFIHLYRSELISDSTEEDFIKVRKMNVDSFPSMYLSLENKYKRVGEGFMEIKEMKKAVAFCYVLFDE